MIQVGSNLFELIEFTVTKTLPKQENQNWTQPLLYGVNVIKVREVIRLPQIVPCQTNSKEILGVFNLRGIPIPAVHLAKVLGYPEEKILPTDKVIITEFSSKIAGFIVSGTKRIRRVSWDSILPPSSESLSRMTGIMSLEDGSFLFILDFEKIFLDIELHASGQNAYAQSYTFRKEDLNLLGFDSKNTSEKDPNHKKNTDEVSLPNTESSKNSLSSSPPALVLVIDDSPTARKGVGDMLKSFQLDVLEFSNGELAWNELKDVKENSELNRVKVIISDVEMPKLDGYSLVKKLRETEKWKTIPIILHSSLIGVVNQERAFSAGATAYVTKLNRKEMLEALKTVLPFLK